MNRRPTCPMVPSTSGWPAWPIRINVAATRHVSLALGVDLRHQRAGGVQHRKAARYRLVDDRLGDSMGTEDRHRAIGNLVQVFNEDGAHSLEPLDDMPVVHNLVADIDRSAELLERPLDNLDRAYDARAKTSRLSHQDTHLEELLTWGTPRRVQHSQGLSRDVHSSAYTNSADRQRCRTNICGRNQLSATVRLAASLRRRITSGDSIAAIQSELAPSISTPSLRGGKLSRCVQLR